MDADGKLYSLETSDDGINWKLRGRFREGDMSRFGKPFSPEVMIEEGKAFKYWWRNKKWLADKLGEKTDSFRDINQRQRVRIIIEL